MWLNILSNFLFDFLIEHFCHCEVLDLEKPKYVTNTAATQTPEILEYFGPCEHEALIKCNATEIYKIKYIQIKNIYIV